MKQVLIVDNEAAIRRGLVACMNWEEQGYTIAGQAVDGIDALEQIRLSPPDIVISDIRMPGMDGLKLAETLRDEWPAIQVILLTGYPDFSYAQRAITYGVVDYVLKPISREGLLSALRLAEERLAEHSSREELRRRLIDTSEENVLLQRSIFLNELIHDKDMDRLAVDERCRELGLACGAYQVLRLHIDLPEGSAEELDDMQEEVQHLMALALGARRHTPIRRGSQNSYYVVEGEDAAGLLALANQVVHSAGALLQCSLTIGLSEVFGGAGGMPEAARQARQAQQFAAYSASSAATPYSDIPAASPGDMDEISAQLRLLRQAVEQRRRQEAHALLGDIFTTIRRARLSLSEVYKIGTFTVHFCVDTLFLQGGLQDLAQMPSTQGVMESESVEEMERNLQGYLDEMMALAPEQSKDTAGLVQQVRQYVEANYSGELTLEALSKVVYLSPSYLSKVFKRETGENLSSYIQNTRIEKAKELLLNTPLKSYEVAEQVGIPDPVYFARMFKRITGVKPKDYRRMQEEGGA